MHPNNAVHLCLCDSNVTPVLLQFLEHNEILKERACADEIQASSSNSKGTSYAPEVHLASDSSDEDE